MRFSTEHQMFRQSMRRFVEQELNPHVDEWEEAGRWPGHAIFKKMGALGFLGLTFPEDVGGQGLDFWFNVIFCEELGRTDCAGVPTGITDHTDMSVPALAEYGSEEVKRRYLAPSLRGDAIGCIAVTEPDAGSDVARIRTRAVSDGDDWVITGRKLYITNGAQADWASVLARTSEGTGAHGMSLIVVPTSASGFSVSRTLNKLGNRSSDTAELILDGVRAPKINTLGPEGKGFQVQMRNFQRERLVASIIAYSSSEKTIERTISYTQQRHAFGQALIQNQAIHFRLAELLTEVEALRALCYAAVERLEAGDDITLLASMAKLKAGRLAREVADSCLQFYGGIGYMEETPIARAYRDARLLSIGGGADEIMLNIIARQSGMLTARE